MNDIYNNKLLDDIIDVIRDAIIIIDTKGIIQKINKAVQDIFEYNIEELLGKNVSILAPSPYKQNHDKYIDNYIKTKKKHILGTTRNLHAIKKNGTKFPIELSVNKLSDKYFIGIIKNVASTNNSTDGVVTTTSNNRILTANNTFCTMFLYNINELINTDISPLYFIDKTDQNRYWGIRKNKHHFPLIISKFKQSTDTIIWIFTDNTYEYNLLNEIKKTQEFANRSIDINSHFLTNISRTIREPANNILKQLEYIKTYSNTTQKNYLLSIKYTNDILDIINDILAFTKIETGKIILETIEFNIINIMEDIVNICNKNINNNDIDISYKIDDDVPINLLGDPLILKQLLLNIIKNSIKNINIYYIKIHIILANLVPLSLKFTIEDNGEYINKYNSQYKPLINSDIINPQDFEKLNINLYICKNIIKYHNGIFEIENNKTTKISFTLNTLKINTKIIKTNAYNISDELLEVFNKLRVYIVTHNITNCLTVESIIKYIGSYIKWSTDTLETLKHLTDLHKENNNYDILFIDYNLNVITGIEFIAILRNIGITSKIVLIMTHNDEHLINTGEYTIIKPITYKKLIKTISNITIQNNNDSYKNKFLIINNNNNIIEPILDIFSIGFDITQKETALYDIFKSDKNAYGMYIICDNTNDKINILEFIKKIQQLNNSIPILLIVNDFIYNSLDDIIFDNVKKIHQSMKFDEITEIINNVVDIRQYYYRIMFINDTNNIYDDIKQIFDDHNIIIDYVNNNDNIIDLYNTYKHDIILIGPDMNIISSQEVVIMLKEKNKDINIINISNDKDEDHIFTTTIKLSLFKSYLFTIVKNYIDVKSIINDKHVFQKNDFFQLNILKKSCGYNIKIMKLIFTKLINDINTMLPELKEKVLQNDIISIHNICNKLREQLRHNGFLQFVKMLDTIEYNIQNNFSNKNIIDNMLLLFDKFNKSDYYKRELSNLHD